MIQGNRQRPLLKSTSLKTTTSANSVISNGHNNRHERKVRFADALGLDLVSIFLSSCQYSILNSPKNHNNTDNSNHTAKSNIKTSILTNHHNSHHLIHSNNNTNNNTNQEQQQRQSQQQQQHNGNSDNNNTTNGTTTYLNNNNHVITNGHHTNHQQHHQLQSNQNNTSHYNNNNYNYQQQNGFYNNSDNTNNYRQLQYLNHRLQTNNYHNNNCNSINTYTNNHVTQKQSSLPTMLASPRKLFSFDHPQPVSLISFHERVKRNKVSLETCNVTNSAGNVSIICSVRVVNISYEKSVIVRFTTNDWSTWTDSLASYIPESRDGWSDKFTSTFSVTNAVRQFQPGQRVIFAIRYSANNEVYWDNNNGTNYILRRSC